MYLFTSAKLPKCNSKHSIESFLILTTKILFDTVGYSMFDSTKPMNGKATKIKKQENKFSDPFVVSNFTHFFLTSKVFL